MPVDMDPNGIISKINHLVRSREDFIRLQINGMFSDFVICRIIQTSKSIRNSYYIAIVL